MALYGGGDRDDIDRIMKAILFTLTCLLAAGLGTGRTAEPKAMADAFFKQIAAGDVKPAYDELMKGSLVLTSQPAQMDNLINQTNLGLKAYGNIRTAELVIEKAYGAYVKKLIYVTPMDKHPLVWRFHFFKSKDGWVVSSASFNDKLDGLD